MTGPRDHVAIYQRLTALYPAPFRAEYRSDLVALFAAQMRDERPTRVWLRALRDLAVTVPTQQLEVRMDRPSGNIVTALFSIVAAASLLLALTLGSGPTAVLFLAGGIAAGLTASWSFNATRSARVPGAVSESWWKFLVAGSSLAAVTLVATRIPWPAAVDIGDLAYWLVVASGMTVISLVGIGIVLAVRQLIRRQRLSDAATPIA